MRDRRRTALKRLAGRAAEGRRTRQLREFFGLPVGWGYLQSGSAAFLAGHAVGDCPFDLATEAGRVRYWWSEFEREAEQCREQREIEPPLARGWAAGTYGCSTCDRLADCQRTESAKVRRQHEEEASMSDGWANEDD